MIFSKSKTGSGGGGGGGTSENDDEKITTDYRLQHELSKPPDRATYASSAARQHLQEQVPRASTRLWSDFYSDEGDEELDHEVHLMSANVKTLLAHQLQNDRGQWNEHDKMVIQRLAMRSFHVPGNSWGEDLVQFWCNNHPIFAFTLADHRHPFGFRERLVNLVASLAFGLAATSMVFLWYYYHERDMGRVIITVWKFPVTEGMIPLLIFGGFLHVMFDFGIWFLQACPPCQTGGVLTKYLTQQMLDFWIWMGAHVGLFISLIAVGLAIYVMILRASIAEDGDDEGISMALENYAFLATYVLEVMSTLFVGFPLVTFVVFTGVLGCGSVPGIGGRPYQVRKMERLRKRRLAKKLAKQKHQQENASVHSDNATTASGKSTGV